MQLPKKKKERENSSINLLFLCVQGEGCHVRGFSQYLCYSLELCCAESLRRVDSLRPHGLQPTRLLCPWGFSSQEYQSGLPCPPPGDLPKPGIKSKSPTLQADSLPSAPAGVTVLHSVFDACPFLNEGRPAPGSFPSATARLQFISFRALPGYWWCFWPRLTLRQALNVELSQPSWLSSPQEPKLSFYWQKILQE